MAHIATALAMAFFVVCAAVASESPPELLERFLAAVNTQLEQLPDYVCTQAVGRFSRPGPERPWQQQDVISLEVAVIGHQEFYARSGDRAMNGRSLIELVGRGTVSTGQFATLARHVFSTRAARFAYRGEGERGGRKTHEFDYEVAQNASGYRLRNGNMEALVAFQGMFTIDAETLDLLDLEVQAFDMPEALGLAQADTRLNYSRFQIDSRELLLPSSASLLVVGTDGLESLNRTRFGECRRYAAESNLNFQVEESVSAASSAAANTPAEELQMAIPSGFMVELLLDADFNPDTAVVGDPVKARTNNPIVEGTQVLLPKGAEVHGKLTRLEKSTQPFPVVEVGFQFDSVLSGDRRIPFTATMVDVSPVSGVIRQSKTLDPKFNRNARPRMDVLVREVQRGQGIVIWDARKGSIPRGLKMKWRVHENSLASILERQ